MTGTESGTQTGAKVKPEAPLTNDPKNAILDDLKINKKPGKSSSNKNEMSSLKKFDKFKT